MLELFETQDGSHSVISGEFGVSYHSRYGAIKESLHVFIEAGLSPLAAPGAELEILEIGMGTGLNVLLSFRYAQQRDLILHYTAFEAFPLPLELAHQLNYASAMEAPQLGAVLQAIHEAPWNVVTTIGSRLMLDKRHQFFQELDEEDRYDLVYFDAFAPQAQPELWEPGLLEKVKRAMKPGGILVTYCAKGAFKRNLRSLGFTVEALPGPPGKREMTKASL